MAYETRDEAFLQALKRKLETGNEFSVYFQGDADPFATTAQWARVDSMKYIKEMSK